MKKRILRLAALLTLACLCMFPYPAAPGGFAEQNNGDVVHVFGAEEEMSLWNTENRLAVFCIPVGAQDCYLLVCDGRAMMLDCAGVGRDPTPDFLFRLLDALQIDHFDFAVNTHPHRDHINGFPELFARVPADVYLSTFELDSDKYQRKLIRELDALGVPVEVLEVGKPLALGGAVLETYRYRKSRNVNDLSLVARVRYGERSILFTADIGLTAQRHMAEEYGEKWKSDVLKLPHHGMEGISAQLFDAVQPELCFASNGETSSNTKRQREFLEKRNTPLYYTSRKALVLLTDGEKWEAQQWPRDSLNLPWYQYAPPTEGK